MSSSLSGGRERYFIPTSLLHCWPDFAELSLSSSFTRSWTAARSEFHSHECGCGHWDDPSSGWHRVS